MQLVWSGFWSCFVIIVLVMFIIVLSKKDLFSYFTWKLLHRLGTISNGSCTLYYGLIESSWISSLICLSFHFHLNKIIDFFFQSHLLLPLKKKNFIYHSIMNYTIVNRFISVTSYLQWCLTITIRWLYLTLLLIILVATKFCGMLSGNIRAKEWWNCSANHHFVFQKLHKSLVFVWTALFMSKHT